LKSIAFPLVPRARALIYRAVTGGNPSTAIGVLDLTERNGVVTIIGSVDGLSPGPHGFHVHEFGDLGNGCLAAGNHFNPLRSDHGSPVNPPSRRHVGDLGNIMTPANDSTMIDIQDSLIAFTGTRGIVGRAFAIHANVDDLGTGGNEGSRTTGNAGSRLACGIIGYVMPGND
uniref:Superoxide dismutase [Cu-Zn] n=1 Tax=Angiostrongylus costaricensis TaxID=334426 RepID=A0A0R3PEU8_ANGCS